MILRERKLGPDVWILRYRDRDGKEIPQRIGTVEKYPTKAAAEKAANKLRKDINERRDAVFVSDLLDRYEKDDLPARVITADNYRSHIKRIRERWGNVRLDVMAKDMMGIEQWLNSQETIPTKNTPARLLAKKSRFNLKALLHRLFERAIFWGMLEMQRNPIGLVTVKGKSGRTRPLIMVTMEAYNKLLRDPELAPHVRMMVMIAMVLGLRASEILGLRWDDFNPDAVAPTLTVQRSVVGKHEDDTKTPTSTQVIPIHPELAEAIAQWKAANSHAATGAPNHQWMFASAITGRPYWRGILQQDHLEPAGRRAGVPGIGWHSFRHTYRTMLAELGEAMEVQQKMMRHTDIKTTMGYGDPRFDQQRRAANHKIFEITRREA